MKYSDLRKDVQTALGPLYKGPIDGEWGALTEAALAAARYGVDAPEGRVISQASGGVVTIAPAPVSLGEVLRADMIDELRNLVGGRETQGSNQSPAIDALWQYTSYPNGWQDRAPYCAATICAVAHRAALRLLPNASTLPLPTSPSCEGMLDWARDPASKCLVFAAGDPAHKPMAGDIVNYLPKLSHTGLLAEDYDGSGLIHTLEGNTNGAGARDGDGFWAKTRPLSLAGHFIRLAAA